MLSFPVPGTFRSGGRIRAAYTLCRHLLSSYGWWRTVGGEGCVNRAGEPIPWFSYPAIDYLEGLDLRGKEIFEWGAGFSTRYWVRRGAQVTSVESAPEWHEKVCQMVRNDATVLLRNGSLTDYCDAIEPLGRFDIIVVDGLGESRLGAVKRALRHLAPGGMIILDNSDLWRAAIPPLTEAGLIQVDFTGFAPMVSGACCTSFFLSRDFAFDPIATGQPKLSPGQSSVPWPDLHNQ